MTGRDLIVYILQNNLEDEPIVKDGRFVWLMTEEQAAIKFDVGVATIKTWYDFGLLQGMKIGDSIFFLKTITNPKERDIYED